MTCRRKSSKKSFTKSRAGDNEPEVIGAAAVEDDFYCGENRLLNKSTMFDPSRLEKAASLISTVGNWSRFYHPLNCAIPKDGNKKKTGDENS